MKRTSIAAEDCAINAHTGRETRWVLLTADDFRPGQFNAMTVDVLTRECPKMYWDNFNDHVLDPQYHKYDTLKDFRRIYLGEILAITGTHTYTTA